MHRTQTQHKNTRTWKYHADNQRKKCAKIEVTALADRMRTCDKPKPRPAIALKRMERAIFLTLIEGAVNA